MGMLGLDRDANGTGLSPAEHQQLIRSKYAMDGIISGCEVTPSTSDMTLNIAPGAVVLPTSGTGAVEGPTPQTKITLGPAPATGETIWDVFVSCENMPGASAKFEARSDGVIPPLVKRIKRWIIPAGVTNAAAGRSAGLEDFAVRADAARRHLIDWVDRAPFGTLAERKPLRNWTQRIYLQRDTMLEFVITQTLSALEGGPRGAMQYIVRDDVEGLITSPVLAYDEWPAGGPRIGGSVQFVHRMPVHAGYHTITLDRQQVRGEQPVHVGGQDRSNAGLVWRPFSRFEVLEAGGVY